MVYPIDRECHLQLCTIAQGGAAIYADIGTYLARLTSIPGFTDPPFSRPEWVLRRTPYFYSLIVPVDYPVPGNVRPCATSFERTDVLYAIWISGIVWDTGTLSFTIISSPDPSVVILVMSLVKLVPLGKEQCTPP